MYSAINREGESLIKSQWVSRSVSFSLRKYALSFFLSLTFSLCLMCMFTRTHTQCVRSHIASIWQARALVPRYPYAANGNGRISFCAVVCIDSAVHSPLYAGCVLAGIFSLLVLTNLAKYEAVWNAVFARCIWNVSFPEFEFRKRFFAYRDRLFILLECVFFFSSSKR